MRDSGYKSTTHALAELIDNSLEADATNVELFGVTRRLFVKERERARLAELAVLDNGIGMDAHTLRSSLRYGDGTRRARAGIGRFGVGLPNSSMSQARCLDVWTWQNGVTNAIHTRLWIDDVESGAAEIPEPRLLPIPDLYFQASRQQFADSGTLVVWSDLDRVQWRSATTTLKHTEILLGRLYRRFLADPSDRLHAADPRQDEIGRQRRITCIPVELSDEGMAINEGDVFDVRPNDPLYLMAGTSCPEDFGPDPMFTELRSPIIIPIKHGGQSYDVRIRASYARPHVRDASHADAGWPEALQHLDAGHTPWGKHAANNSGVSLIRAHREVQLDDSWVSHDDPRERWWTVEVDFPPALDELFGVTNNKQHASIFQRLASYDWRREALPGEESKGDVRRRMEDEHDPRAALLGIRKAVGGAISQMRVRVRQARKPRPRPGLSTPKEPEWKVTAAILRRITQGSEGASDVAAASGTPDEHLAIQLKSLIDRHHMAQVEALRHASETIRNKHRVDWIQSRLPTPAFFEVESLPGLIRVALNVDHPVYSGFYEVMNPEVEELGVDDLQQKLEDAAKAFRILIYAWARYEDEQNVRQRRQVQGARIEWGKYAAEFFDDDDESLGPIDDV